MNSIRLNVGLLAACQAMLFANSSTLVAINGLAGYALSPYTGWSLVLLGVGWNFLYIGGTTLLTETYRPEERAKAQGANDQAIFIMMAISSITSGLAVTAAGWERVNLLALPLVVGVSLAIGWFAMLERARRAAASA
jgi:MFS family permease